MFWSMRVRGDVAVEPLVEHLLGRPLLLAEAPAGHEVSRGLELAAHAHEAHRDIRVLLDGAVAFRMGDNHVIAQALELVDGALVVLEAPLGAAGVELEEELAPVVETEIGRPFLDAQLNELGMRHLEAHGQRDAHRLCVGRELVIGGPHGLVVEVGVAGMGGAYDGGHARRARRLEHGDAHPKVTRAVIHTGQDVTVHVPHADPSPCLRRRPCGALLVKIVPRLVAGTGKELGRLAGIDAGPAGDGLEAGD